MFPWEPGSGGLLATAERKARLLEIREIVQGCDASPAQKVALARRAAWLYVHARPKQIEPAQDDWDIWFLLGGRGSGKTRTGAEKIAEWAQDLRKSRWALVAPTLTDVRETQIEGDSGLLSVLPKEVLWGGSLDKAYNSGRPQLTLANGAILRGYSSEKPDRLRGPQFHGFWLEEPASLKDSLYPPDDPLNLNTTWSNLRLGTRLKPETPVKGFRNKAIITGTPKAVGLLAGSKSHQLPGLLTGYEGVRKVTMDTSENFANLSAFYQKLEKKLRGTRLGRQELAAELLTDVQGALLQDHWIVVADPPPLETFTRLAVGVDPAGSHRSTSDETGIILGGVDSMGMLWVLGDYSGIYSPAQWRDLVADLYLTNKLDAVVVERNFGADLVVENLANSTVTMNIIDVHASKGKLIRAEPIAGIYEVRTDAAGKPVEEPGERIRHADWFAALRDQWTTWVPPKPGQPKVSSPDRLDAEVHLMHWLTNGGSDDYWGGTDLLTGMGTYS